MSEQKKHIDDLFREKMGSHTEAPPSFVWKNLEQKLDSTVTPANVVSYYKWMKYGVILSAVTVLVYFTGRKLADTGDAKASATEQVVANETSQNNEGTIAGNAVAGNGNAVANATAQVTNADNQPYSSENSVTNTQADPATKNATSHNDKLFASNDKVKERQDAKTASAQSVASRSNKSTIQAYSGKSVKEEYAQNSLKHESVDHNNTTAQKHNTQQVTQAGNNGPQNKPNNTAAKNNAPQAVNNAANTKNNAGQAGNNATKNNSEQNIVPAAANAAVKPAATKPVSTPEFINDLAVKNDKTKKIHRQPLVETGFKLGYELGFGRYAASKYVIAPYIQYGFGKLAIALQPTLKIAVNKHKANIGNVENYYEVTKQPFSNPPISDVIDANTNMRTKTYLYQETHDSIVIGHRIDTKSYTEVELPLLLKYNVAKNATIYGGLLINYSTKAIQIKEDRQVYSVSGVDTFAHVFPANGLEPGIPEAATRFNYSGIAYVQYTNAPYQNATVMKLQTGYMLGFTYTVKDRYLLDVSMQQNLSNMNYVPNKEVRSIYTQPYFRISAGYKLFKSK